MTGKNVENSLYLIVFSHRDSLHSLYVSAAYLSYGQD